MPVTSLQTSPLQLAGDGVGVITESADFSVIFWQAVPFAGVGIRRWLVTHFILHASEDKKTENALAVRMSRCPRCPGEKLLSRQGVSAEQGSSRQRLCRSSTGPPLSCWSGRPSASLSALPFATSLPGRVRAPPVLPRPAAAARAQSTRDDVGRSSRFDARDPATWRFNGDDALDFAGLWGRGGQADSNDR